VYTLGEQVTQRERDIATLKDELAGLRQVYEEALAVLTTKTAELEVSQKFLAKDDHVAGADVTKMVEALNSDILQIAASLGEAFEFAAQRSSDPPSSLEEADELEDAIEQVEEVLGARMTDFLRSSNHDEDPILVQMALQASMCAFCNWIISSWFFHSIEKEQLLEDIYEHIRDSGARPHVFFLWFHLIICPQRNRRYQGDGESLLERTRSRSFHRHQPKSRAFSWTHSSTFSSPQVSKTTPSIVSTNTFPPISWND
jgi:hypothetical protein